MAKQTQQIIVSPTNQKKILENEIAECSGMIASLDGLGPDFTRIRTYLEKRQTELQKAIKPPSMVKQRVK